jgi:hypothetical protein
MCGYVLKLYPELLKKDVQYSKVFLEVINQGAH